MSNIIRRDPLDEILRGFFVRHVDFTSGVSGEAPQIRVDIKEESDAFLIYAELLGVNKNDIQVNIDGALVSISEDRAEEKEVREGDRILRKERYFGKVSRSFQLAQYIDDDKATAKLTDGVLELHLPKKVATPAKQLKIE